MSAKPRPPIRSSCPASCPAGPTTSRSGPTAAPALPRTPPSRSRCKRRSVGAEAQGPGVGGGITAQLVDPGRHARARCRLDPPELKLGPAGLGLGILPPLPVDDPVLEDGADGVQPALPYEPGRPAVVPGLDAHRLAVHHAHGVFPARLARGSAAFIRIYVHSNKYANNLCHLSCEYSEMSVHLGIVVVIRPPPRRQPCAGSATIRAPPSATTPRDRKSVV